MIELQLDKDEIVDLVESDLNNSNKFEDYIQKKMKEMMKEKDHAL